RHAGAAGDAVNEAPGAVEDAVQDPLGGGHFPQDIHVDATAAVGALIGHARLLDAPRYRVGDQLLMALAPGASVVELRDQLARLVVAVGVDPGKRADPVGGGPGSRAFAIRNRDALATLDKRQHLKTRNPERIERPHPIAPCSRTASVCTERVLCRSGRSPAARRIISGASEKTEVTPHSNSRSARSGSFTVKASNGYPAARISATRPGRSRRWSAPMAVQLSRDAVSAQPRGTSMNI